MFSTYDLGMDENNWTFVYGWGGAMPRTKDTPYLAQRYRFQIEAKWFKLSSCFQWWRDVIQIDRSRECRLVIQDRIHSWERWPISVRYQSAAKNLYDDHPLAAQTEFWRCDHDVTGFGPAFTWGGCWRCAVWRPIKSVRTHLRGGMYVDRKN